MISIGTVFADATQLYRLLWRRSLPIAAVVFAVIQVASVLAQRSLSRTRRAGRRQPLQAAGLARDRQNRRL